MIREAEDGYSNTFFRYLSTEEFKYWRPLRTSWRDDKLMTREVWSDPDNHELMLIAVWLVGRCKWTSSLHQYAAKTKNREKKVIRRCEQGDSLACSFFLSFLQIWHKPKKNFINFAQGFLVTEHWVQKLGPTEKFPKKSLAVNNNSEPMGQVKISFASGW